LKVLEKWKMKELSVQENVIREIKLNMFLNHPNIAKLYACFHDQHYIYLITEYATNNNLYELIKQPKINRKETNSEKVTKLVGQICEAVRYIHQHCVIHRDIKPENILLTMVTVPSFRVVL
jgi:serine/threonine protein kinase